MIWNSRKTFGRLLSLSILSAIFGIAFPAIGQISAKTSKSELVRRILTFASTMEKNGKTGEAIIAYSDVIKIDPDNLFAYEQRALLLLKESKLEDAFNDYSFLIKRRPKEFGLWFNRSLVLRRMKKFREALSDLDQAERLNSTSPLVIRGKGLVLLELNELDDARRYLDKAIELDPRSSAKHTVGKSVYCFKIFDTECILVNSTKAIDFDPTSAPAFNNRGYALILKGELRAARSDIEQAIKLSPKWSYPYNNRALLSILEKKWENASIDVEKALELEPDLGEAFDNRGLIHLENRNLDEAIKQFDRAIELSTQIGPCIFTSRKGVVSERISYTSTWGPQHRYWYQFSFVGKLRDTRTNP